MGFSPPHPCRLPSNRAATLGLSLTAIVSITIKSWGGWGGDTPALIMSSATGAHINTQNRNTPTNHTAHTGRMDVTIDFWADVRDVAWIQRPGYKRCFFFFFRISRAVIVLQQMAGSIFRQAGQCSDGTDWCTKSHQSSASSETLLPARLLIDHAPSEGLDTGAQLYNMLWNNVTKWAEKLLFSVSVTHLISSERWCSHHRQILWKVQKKQTLNLCRQISRIIVFACRLW